MERVVDPFPRAQQTGHGIRTGSSSMSNRWAMKGRSNLAPETSEPGSLRHAHRVGPASRAGPGSKATAGPSGPPCRSARGTYLRLRHASCPDRRGRSSTGLITQLPHQRSSGSPRQLRESLPFCSRPPRRVLQHLPQAGISFEAAFRVFPAGESSAMPLWYRGCFVGNAFGIAARTSCCPPRTEAMPTLWF